MREQLNEYLQKNKELERFAAQFGIDDIYQDNNVKQLQQALYLGLTFNPQRGSADATDRFGNPWELKSLNVVHARNSFTTCACITDAVLDRYEKCNWAFSLYENTELKTIYVMHPSQLFYFFNDWRKRIKTQPRLNNPKIRVSYVRENGFKVYDSNFPNLYINPVFAINSFSERMIPNSIYT